MQEVLEKVEDSIEIFIIRKTEIGKPYLKNF